MQRPQKRQRIVQPTQPGTNVFSVMSSQPQTKKCQLCDRNVTRSDNLKRHLVEQHNVHQNRISNFLSEAEDNDQEDDNQQEDSDDLFESDSEETQDEQYNSDSGNDLYHLLRDKQRAAGDVDEEQADQDISMIESAINEHYEWNHFKSATFPFANIESMIMHALVDGDNDMMSERMLKKILFTIKLILIVAEKATKDGTMLCLPRLDALMRYQTRLRNQIPIIPSKFVNIEVNNNNFVEAYVNLPSEHLKLLAANPKKGKRIFSLPDRTPNQSVSFQQGEKWRNNKFFQQPMWTVNGVDFWSGDIVRSWYNNREIDLLIESFHSSNSIYFARGYEVFLSTGTPFVYVKETCSDVLVDDLKFLVCVDRSLVNSGMFFTLNDANQPLVLSEAHTQLLSAVHFMKKPVEDNNGIGRFYKVRISPIVLFTDDTSGNSSKQFNMYESWSMRCASLSFKERSSLENVHFLGAVQKKDGASGTSLIPTIVQDLKKLEKGVKMYSAIDNEYVLVVAPLLLIEADSPCHSELCGLLAPTTLYPCRKCYIRLQRGKRFMNPDSTYYTRSHKQRLRKDYEEAARTSDRSTLIRDAPEVGFNLEARKLSFKNRGTDSLLELEAFDPQKDTPTEILHVVLLGVAKYLVNDLVKNVATKAEISKLSSALDNYKSSNGFTRKFSRKLQHCGSFLGRDYKILLQVLPVILVTEFTEASSNLAKIIPCFLKLGKLCSLIFVREISNQFYDYLRQVDDAVKELLLSLYQYDLTCTTKDHKGYVGKPKIHFLSHIVEDIQRFGTALNFETEKGEQFNKHIREHIFHTNKTHVSKQIAIKFGKQEVMRHIVDGGSWMDGSNRRVKAGPEVLLFVERNALDFYHNLFGGTREFIENNESDFPTIQSNTFACFSKKASDNSSQHFVGRFENGLVTHFFICPATSEDLSRNILRAKVSTIVSHINELTVDCVLDMHTKDETYHYVNLSKFGTYWYLHNTLHLI